MDKYIITYDNVLSFEECDDIIERIKTEPLYYSGVMGGGLDKRIKDTCDYSIPLKESKFRRNHVERDIERWECISSKLIKKLTEKINDYIIDVDKTINAWLSEGKEYDNCEYNVLNRDLLFVDTLLYQKYSKCEGKYRYHMDDGIHSVSNIDSKENKVMKRVLTYIYYLNDVEEGGETELFGNIRIVPECGKLLLFPSEFVYPHMGRVPISVDKHIITGWVYMRVC